MPPLLGTAPKANRAGSTLEEEHQAVQLSVICPDGRCRFVNVLRPFSRLQCPFFEEMSFIADGLQPFRVSDAVRRRKVDGARTRGPQTVAYGDLSLGRSWVR